MNDMIPEEKMIRLIHRVARAMMIKLDQALEEAALSGVKMWTLSHLIHSDEPLGITQLARCLHSGKSNATQVIDRLEAEGLVRRVANPDDRRSILIEVTDKGHQRFEEAVAIRHQVSREIATCLSSEESDQLEALLTKLAEQLP